MPARAPSDQLNVRSQSILPIVGAAFVLCARKHCLLQEYGAHKEHHSHDTECAKRRVSSRKRLVFATPNTPNANEGRRQEGKEQKTRPGQRPSLSASFLHATQAHQGEQQHRRAGPPNQHQVVKNRKPPPHRVAEHPHNKKPHLDQRRPGMRLQLLEGAEHGRDALVPIRIGWARRIMSQAVKIEPHGKESQDDPAQQTFASSPLSRFPAQTRSLAA